MLCVAVCCSVLQCVAVCCSASQYVAVGCSVLQCVAVCCSALQCVTTKELYPHKNLLGIQRVLNPFSGNQRISTPAHSIVVHIDKYVNSELMVAIQQKTGTGVENPHTRSFLSGLEDSHTLTKPPETPNSEP